MIQQLTNRINELLAYPDPTKNQLKEVIELQAKIISMPRSIDVPFSTEDCEDLRDGAEFNWSFEGIDLNIYNSDENPREGDDNFDPDLITDRG